MLSALRLGLSRPAHSIPLTAPSTAAATTTAAATARAFSSTPAILKRAGNWDQGTPTDSEIPIPKPSAKDPHIPPYPYGPRTVYKQSNSGLYGLARIRSGHNVSPKHNVKTNRKWRPHVQRHRLWSAALGCWVQSRMTANVLRTTDKVGGLDSYLLGNKPRRIKELGPWGWKLRWRVMQALAIRQRLRDQRGPQGLPPTQEELDEYYRAQVRSASTGEGPVADIDRMLERGEDISFGHGDYLNLGPENSSVGQEDIVPMLDLSTPGPEEPSPAPKLMPPDLEPSAASSEDLSPAAPQEPTAPLGLTAPRLEDLASQPEADLEPSAASSKDLSPAAPLEPKAPLGLTGPRLEDLVSQPEETPRPKVTKQKRSKKGKKP